MSSRVALVAGGSTGIGLATAKLLASKGYKVAISGLGEAEVAAAVQICAKLSPNNEQVSLLLSLNGFSVTSLAQS